MIIANMLAILVPKIISEHQRNLIRGGHIYKCVGITSEANNMLDNKSFGGSTTLKVRKVINTLYWKYLIKVLVQLNFDQKFCE